jgi:hypothetical protein
LPERTRALVFLAKLEFDCTRDVFPLFRAVEARENMKVAGTGKQFGATDSQALVRYAAYFEKALPDACRWLGDWKHAEPGPCAAVPAATTPVAGLNQPVGRRINRLRKT